jgi:hypothetical protein
MKLLDLYHHQKPRVVKPALVILSEYFRKPGQSLISFAAEVAKLSPEDLRLLCLHAAEQLNYLIKENQK